MPSQGVGSGSIPHRNGKSPYAGCSAEGRQTNVSPGLGFLARMSDIVVGVLILFLLAISESQGFLRPKRGVERTSRRSHV